jgi:hypothetical protein
LYDDLGAVLARIPKCASTLLTSAARALDRKLAQYRCAAGESCREVGRAQPSFSRSARDCSDQVYVADLSIRLVVEITEWEEDHVETIIRRCVGRLQSLYLIGEKRKMSCKTDCKTDGRKFS